MPTENKPEADLVERVTQTVVNKMREARAMSILYIPLILNEGPQQLKRLYFYVRGMKCKRVPNEEINPDTKWDTLSSYVRLYQ